MKKHFNLETVFALMLLVAATTFLISMKLVRDDYNRRLVSTNDQLEAASKLLEAQELILNQFVGETSKEEILDGAIEGMVSSTGDRWSYYLTAEEYKASQESKDSFVGIGVTATRYMDTEFVWVTQVYDDSSAMEEGIEPLDIITSINGEDIESLGYDNALERISGEENTTVTLTLKKPNGQTYSVTVRRRNVPAVHVFSELLESNIGYVRVTSFSSRVDDEFNLALDNLITAGARGFVFDMRFNPGGELRALESILDRILPDNKVIIKRQLKSGEEIITNSDETSLDYPMVVLVNEGSYSASEFFAACLQEHGLARVVGERTVGKGYAQHPLKLQDGSCIFLSTESYYTPNGVSLAGVGVEPDYVVTVKPEDRKSFYDPRHIGDEQLEKAIAVMRETVPAPAEDTADSTPAD